MKRVIIGLIMVGMAGVAHAAVFTNVTADTNGDYLWSNTDNWDPEAVPTNTTAVNIWSDSGSAAHAHAVIDTNYTAYAAAIKLEAGGSGAKTGGRLTIDAGGILNATSLTAAKNTDFWNYGVINLAGKLSWGSTAAAGFNYGTINLTNGGDLSLSKGSFNNSGDFTGDDLMGPGGGGTLNLTGGTMTFNDVSYFDVANTMNVQFPGMLVVEGQDMTNDLQTAIDLGRIESGGDLDLSSVGGNTFLKVSGTVYQAEGTVFQEGVSPTTVYDQGATYIRSGTGNTNSNFDADGDFELLVGAIAAGNQLARGLLEFDLSFIQAATEIDSVSLILTTLASTPGQGNTNTFNVHAYDSDIVETVSTWNDPDGDGGDVSGDATAGGTLGTLLASATFDCTQTDLTVTFSNSAPFRAAVTAALADDDILRLIVVNGDEDTFDTGRFARFTADSFGTPSSRPKLVVSHNWSTFQEGVAPDASYTHHATFIHAGSTTGNYNDDADFLVGVGASAAIRGLLEFDVSSIPSAHVIDTTSLTFTTKAGGAGGENTFNLYAYAYDFDETTASWSAPGSGDSTAGGTLGSPLASATFDIDATGANQKITFGDGAAFRAAVSAALAGDGFLRMILVNADESEVNNIAYFWKDEAAGSEVFNSPKLEVISHMPPQGTLISIK